MATALVQVSDRNPDTQRLVDRMAHEFFRPDEARFLEATIAKPIAGIKFNVREYMGLNYQFPFSDIHMYHAFNYFYKFVLTFDKVLSSLRGFRELVRNMDHIGDILVLEGLKRYMPSPSFIPWFLFQRDWFKRLSPHQQRQYAVPRWPQRGEAYLMKFPLISNVIALTQGLYLVSPHTDDEVWVNADAGVNTPCLSYSMPYTEQDLSSAYTQRRRLYVEAKTESLAQAAVSCVQPNPKGGPMNTTDDAAYRCIAALQQLPNQADEQRFTETLMRLADAFKRSGALLAMYQTLNTLLREFEAALARTSLTQTNNPTDFTNNLVTGPLFGENLKCPEGHMVLLVDHDGNPLSQQEAIYITPSGQRMVSGKVDVTKSGCRLAFPV